MTTLRALLPLCLCLGTACNEPSMDGEDGGTADSGDPSGDDGSEVPQDCGNDVIDEGEECDGADLGGLGCADLGAPFAGGTLACGATCTLDASACEADPGAPLVRLNEMTSDSVMGGPFANGASDAIELHNAGGSAADLSGWQLSDDPMLLMDRTYVFPDGTMLEPGAFIVVTQLDNNTMQGDYPFGINDSAEEEITLADAGGTVVDSLLLDGYHAVVSFCRVPDATGAWDFCVQTFGEPNSIAGAACGNGTIEDGELCDSGDLGGVSCESLELGFSGGQLLCHGQCRFDTRGCTTSSDLVINELEATMDDLELFNGGSEAVDLSGVILTDDRIDATYDPQLDTAELVFPAGTTLGPGEYLVVPVGLGPGQHPFGLGMQGDTVSLIQPSPLTVIDQVTYQSGEAQTSYCRQPNGPGGTWTDGCNPTFGAAN